MSNDLGRWVQKELKRRGWNQVQLAEMAKINQANISRLINKTPKRPHEAVCGDRVAQGLARAFGVSPVFVMRLAGILKTPSRNRNFSTWLTGELLLKEFSQEQLSERSGLELDTIQELMKGIPPSLEMVEKLALVFDIDPLILQDRAGLLPLGVEDPMFEQAELDLIRDYRTLPPVGQAMAREMMQTFVKNFKSMSKD